ncbi:hypothetical protein Afil01_62230 [Actinorhabdospora filicis]|uniref:Peptidase S74 domain-containing protein n=1 Tax=Actinorhabdospora filicis TaxID=1785913 RepID=A0A9W6SVB4_9ACTN|nr:hypothetical protein [Actinorhabdospora filicis]GLZ81416.1 hypothetical protein Afil01_62230 [Actinorhabdospora filicis]
MIRGPPEPRRPRLLHSYPFDAQDTTETDFSRLFRELQDSGVADSAGGAGYRVSADSSAMAVTVAPGLAILRGHAAHSTAPEALPIENAGPASRIDRVVLRLDPAANGISLAVLTGTPGAGAPVLTTTDTDLYELPLALVYVDANAVTISAERISDERRYVGHRLGCWTSATRPTNPRKARLGLNETTGRWEYWTGTDWSDLAPSIAWGDIAGRPTAFQPTTHSHTLADLPATLPPSPHAHAAADISTGTINAARLPVGTATGTVAAGDHRHEWRELLNTPRSYNPDPHDHDQYVESDGTVAWSNGSRRVRGSTPGGSATWYTVWIDGSDRFTKNTSRRAHKQNFRRHVIGWNRLSQLAPLLYDRRPTTDPDTGEEIPGPRDEYGLVAEDVAAAVPELAVIDANGEPDAVRYDLIGLALLDHVRALTERVTALEAALGARP